MESPDWMLKREVLPEVPGGMRSAPGYFSGDEWRGAGEPAPRPLGSTRIVCLAMGSDDELPKIYP